MLIKHQLITNSTPTEDYLCDRHGQRTLLLNPVLNEQ